MQQDIEKYEEYLTEYKSLSDNTRAAYLRDVKQFVEFMYERRVLLVEEISQEDLQAYLDQLGEEEFSESTVARKKMALKSFYRFLYRYHNVKMEWLENIKTRKVARKEPNILSVENMELLLQQPSGNGPKAIRDKAILELMYATGIRVSELVSLQREQIDLQMDQIVCGAKGKERTIPFGAPAREALLRYIQEARMYFVHRDDNRTVFLNHSGEGLSRQGIFKLVKHYGEKAELEQAVTPEMIRQSFAAHLLGNGADIRSVQKMMGHNDIGTTAFYGASNENIDLREYRKAHPRG